MNAEYDNIAESSSENEEFPVIPVIPVIPIIPVIPKIVEKKLHKCAKNDCDAQTSKEFCRHHSVVYHVCGHPGCARRCRREYCNWHNPITMERKRQRIAEIRRAAKNRIALVK